MMITKKNYFPIVCITFTFAVLIKILVENVIGGYSDLFYAQNIVVIFVFSALIVAVLGASKYFTKLPLWIVIALQYIIVISAAMLDTKINDLFSEMSRFAYRDMFRSVTVAFAIAAFFYYVKCFHDVYKANQDLEKLQKMVNKGIYPDDKA